MIERASAWGSCQGTNKKIDPFCSQQTKDSFNLTLCMQHDPTDATSCVSSDKAGHNLATRTKVEGWVHLVRACYFGPRNELTNVAHINAIVFDLAFQMMPCCCSDSHHQAKVVAHPRNMQLCQCLATTQQSQKHLFL